MHSKTILLSILSLIVFACSADSEYSRRPIKPRIGNYVQSFHSSLNGGQHTSGYFAVAEQKQNTVQIFKKDPFELVETIEIERLDLSRLLLSPDLSYGLAIGKSSYAIINKNRDIIYEPVSMLGAISSVSYRAEDHLLVLQGVHKSIILIQLDPEGNVVSHLAKGPNTDDQADDGSLGRIISGVLLKGGHFIVGTDTGKLLDIDVKASIQKGDWELQELPLGSEDPILFVDSNDETSDNPNFWVLTEKSLRIYDYQSESVLDEMAVNGYRLVGIYSQQVPHLYLKKDERANQQSNVEDEETVSDTTQVDFRRNDADTGEFSDWYVEEDDHHDGEFSNWYEREGYTVVYQKENKLRTKDVQILSKPVQGSFLDRGLQRLAVIHNEDLESQDIYEPQSQSARQEIYVVRFSDGLPAEVRSIRGRAQLVLDDVRYFRIYHSELGYAESWRYGTDHADQKLDFFNFRRKHMKVMR